MLAAFGIFAVGFLMRPLGGALFGHIGDRFGRPAALTFSVAAMAMPTFLIGVLPGYAVLGFAAPVLLTLLRMIQGLSVGGEYTTSIVFLVERARPERRGVVGAVADLGAVCGILLGSATGAILESVMPAEAVTTGAGGFPSGSAFWSASPAWSLRRGLAEERARRPTGRAPAAGRDLQQHWRVLAAPRRHLGVRRGRLLPDVRLHRELAAVRRRHRAGAGADDQHHQHGCC